MRSQTADGTLSWLSETWRPKKAEIWESQQGHMYMGAGKFENKHGVAILLNKKWRKKIHWTQYNNERAIATSSQQTADYTNECVLSPLGMRGPTRRKSVQVN